MCLEKQSISAPLGDDTSATLDADRPILRVDDPRLDRDDPMMQRRRKVLAVLGKNFPMALKYAEVTARGLVAPYMQGDYKDAMGWAKAVPPKRQQNTCAPVNGRMMTLVGASGIWGFGVEGVADASTNWKVQRPQDGWVPYAPGRLPSVGDVFILYEEIAKGVVGAGHCGVVCQASLVPDEFWITGDGGQPDRTGELHQRKSDGRWVRSYSTPDPDYPPDLSSDLNAGEAAYLVPRKLDCTDPKNPRVANFFVGGGGETLHGWRSVTHPKIRFKNDGAYDETGSQQDYESFKAMILEVDAAAKAEAKWRATSKPDGT